MPVTRLIVLASLIASSLSVPTALCAGSDDASAVGLVDIAYIFSKHERYKQRIEALGKKTQAAQKELVEKDAAINKKIERLKDFALGTPDFKKLEEEIAREKSDNNVTKMIKQKELREEDARIHYETYQEVVQEVTRIASSAQCRLVLRFDSQEIDERNPVAVQAGIGRLVIYADREMDMTPFVIKALNTEVAAKPNPNGGRPSTSTKGGSATGSKVPR
jgi:Skp family chaperone for outer membrane proteins